MKYKQKRELTWLDRFSSSGWLSLCLTLVAIPPVYWLLHFIMGIGWAGTALIGAVVSVVVAHILLFPVLFFGLWLMKPALFCELCPACGERALSVGPPIADRMPSGRLQIYDLAACSNCERRFHGLDDGTYEEVSQ